MPLCVQLPSKSPSLAFAASPSQATQATQAKPKSRMDFTEDPFRDYRYEDPFNLADPFADAPDSTGPLKASAHLPQEPDSFAAFSPPPVIKIADVNKNSSFAAFETDDFFATSRTFEKNNNDAFGGRQSVPLPTNDPFSKSGRMSVPIQNNNNSNLAAWGGGWNDSDDNWATTDGWADTSTTSNTSKSSSQYNTWTTGKTKPAKPAKEAKKEKSPKPLGKKSFTQTLGNLGRHKTNKNLPLPTTPAAPTAPSLFPSEEQQLAWAAAEGRRLEEERRQRREEEDQDLKMAMALSIRNQ